MPSSRKIVPQTVYFDSWFNLSYPSIPTDATGSPTPPECDGAPTGMGAQLRLGMSPWLSKEQ